jgi:hypothetical protein
VMYRAVAVGFRCILMSTLYNSITKRQPKTSS